MLIAAACFLWASAAALGRMVLTGMLAVQPGQPALDPVILAQARTTISFLILAPTLLWIRGRGPLTLPRRDVLSSLAMGVLGLAGANYFYYYAIMQVGVATAIIVQYTAPAWVLIFMIAAGQQRPTASRIAGVSLAMCGCALAIGVLVISPNSPFVHLVGVQFRSLGVLAALGASFSFASYNIMSSRLLQRQDRWTVFLYALLGCAIFWLLLNPPWRWGHYTAPQWIFLIVFAIVSMLLPNPLYFAGLQQLDPTRAIVISCLEPVFAILLTAILVGENPTMLQIVGMTVVLIGTVVIQLPERADRGTFSVEHFE